MFCKVSFLKNFGKFARKNVCRSLIFNSCRMKVSQNSQANISAENKVAGWENSKNSVEKYSAGDLFSIKLQAGSTISTSYCWYTNYVTYKISKLFVPFTQCVLTHNRKVHELFMFCQYHIECRELWWWSAKKKIKIKRDKDPCSDL